MMHRKSPVPTLVLYVSGYVLFICYILVSYVSLCEVYGTEYIWAVGHLITAYEFGSGRAFRNEKARLVS